jgi:FixJ family two-component response regulator
LESVQSAIRTIVSDKAKAYSIGGRSFTRLDLSELRERESQLKAEVVRERKANMIANGLGNPHSLFVRF